ncbi:MAG: TldD/PmbA family protein [candidate division WOR-3 bacterium]|jgi:TldD protein|nr:TldD/PmbA family protein [candidate division WOR-3 bacterium]MCR4424097.1 TldD/PmbA family protein [candidate division WOR-3 bacterium]MDH7519484.1 TldD/PmbA family protein [bacterium]
MKNFLKGILDGLTVDYADIRVEESESTQVVYLGKELERIGTSFERGGCMRVFHQGNWITATFNTIDESLKELADELALQALALPRRENGLVFLPALEQRIRLPKEQHPARVSLAEKHDLIKNYNSILLNTPGIVTTVSAYADLHRMTYLYTTEDRYIEQEQVYTGVTCRAVARDGANIQSYGETFGKCQGFNSLRHQEARFERVAKIALDLLTAEPVKAGKYTVVVDPILGGVFVHEAFGHMSEADFIAENERLREKMRIGARFGVEQLTIVDDATLPEERGSYHFDEEGTPAQRTELIRHGILVGHLHSRQTAQQMQEEPTGNCRAVSYRFAPIVRMSNTYIEPRDKKLDEMVGEIDYGLYVVGSRGGMTELEAFTFSSQYAYLIEKGKLTKMVRDVTLSGNVFETMMNIDAIGNDLIIHGGLGGCGKAGQAPLPVGTGAPHIRIKNVVVGGR